MNINTKYDDPSRHLIHLKSTTMLEHLTKDRLKPASIKTFHPTHRKSSIHSERRKLFLQLETTHRPFSPHPRYIPSSTIVNPEMTYFAHPDMRRPGFPKKIAATYHSEANHNRKSDILFSIPLSTTRIYTYTCMHLSRAFNEEYNKRAETNGLRPSPTHTHTHTHTTRTSPSSLSSGPTYRGISISEQKRRERRRRVYICARARARRNPSDLPRH